MRQTGRTTNQLKNCVKDSYFIVKNRNMIPYVKKILKEIDREDINVESLYFITNESYRGIHFSGIVFDHSIDLTCELQKKIYHLSSVNRIYPNKETKNSILYYKSNIDYYQLKNIILKYTYNYIDFFNIFYGGNMEYDNMLFVYNMIITKFIYEFMESEIKSRHINIDKIMESGIDFIYNNTSDEIFEDEYQFSNVVSNVDIDDILSKWKKIHLDLINRRI